MSKELPRVMAAAGLLASRLIQRENTDFLGRMDEALSRAQGLCDDGDPCDNVDATKSYRDQMVDLASLALAQAAMAEAAIPKEIGDPAGSAQSPFMERMTWMQKHSRPSSFIATCPVHRSRPWMSVESCGER